MKKIFMALLIIISFFYINVYAETYTSLDIKITDTGKLETPSFKFENFEYSKSDNIKINYVCLSIGNDSYDYDAVIKLYDKDNNELYSETFKDNKGYTWENTLTLDNSKFSDFNLVDHYTFTAIYNEDYLKREEFKEYDYIIKDYTYSVLVNDISDYIITENIELKHNNDNSFIRIIPKKYEFKNKYGSGTITVKVKKLDDSEYSHKVKFSEDDDNYYFEFINDANTNKTEKYTLKYSFIVLDHSFVFFPLVPTTLNIPVQYYKYDYTISDNLKINKYIIGGKSNSSFNEKSINEKIFKNEEYYYMASINDVIHSYKADTSRYKNGFLTSLVTLFITILLVKFTGGFFNLKNKAYYPLSKFSSTKFAMLFQNFNYKYAISALLLELCNEGYIEIIHDNKELKIRMIKKYNSYDRNKKLLFDKLFENGTLFSKNIKKDDFDEVYDHIYKNVSREVYLLKKVTFKDKLITFIMYALCFICYLAPYKLYLVYNTTFMNFICLFSFLIVFICRVSNKKLEENHSLFVSEFCIFLPALLFLVRFYNINYVIIIYVILSSIASYINYYLAVKFNPSRRFNRIYSHFNDFYAYISSLKSNDLVKISLKHPNYIYDILPYAYSINQLKKWLVKFETLNIQKPSWFKTNREFRIDTFDEELSDIMLKYNMLVLKDNGITNKK